jgi:hypothetical protein
MIQIIIDGVISYSHSLYTFTVKKDGDFVATGQCSGVQILKAAKGKKAFCVYRTDSLGIQQHIISCIDAIVTLGKDVPESVIEDLTLPEPKEKARVNACHGKVLS